MQNINQKNAVQQKQETMEDNQVSKVPALDPTEESLKVATPAWPLQNTVAVNPFWFYRDRKFEAVLEDLASTIHNSLFMPMDFYHKRIRSGEISSAALSEALRDARNSIRVLPETVDELILRSESHVSLARQHQTIAESLAGEVNWSTIIVNEVGKYASTYLDERQGLAQFPWRAESFWHAWIQGQQFDRAMDIVGLKRFQNSIQHLQKLSPREAIAFMLEKLGVRGRSSQIAYLQRLMATVLGWGTQFKYVEWQRQLGYQGNASVATIDLLAVRMAYDYGLFKAFESTHSNQIAKWRDSLGSDRPHSDDNTLHFYHFQYVFQLALELSYQKKVAALMKTNRPANMQPPKAQMAFCIDVRSEMIRRQIEQADSSIQTIGFAGFFGVPFDYKKLDECESGHRLPVLLTPAFKVEESGGVKETPEPQPRLNRIFADSFFRSLRKNPMSSFVYVELFGALYIAKMVKRTWKQLTKSLLGTELPDRFDTQGHGPSLDSMCAAGQFMSLGQKADRAAGVLQHMGLTEGFADLVFIVGHGSETTNNAFGSALDCGACGGHAGDINARLLADLLNDSKVRLELKSRGIEIPGSTWFVAAVHETVTDRVFILDEEKVPTGFNKTLLTLKGTLEKASGATREERLENVSNVIDRRADRRAHNWSEVRPEWGLTGNACFVVAPRERTRGINLSSRSFLHDYDWRKDAKNDFKTLELIMTAPMVVTNWINMQYFASTVAPSVYGSGNKILHNLTNETGVVEGNGGDLRVGLPIQSVHDGRDFVHDPLRLSVFIEAPKEEIEKLIQKHEVVKQLIGNGWLHLLHIDPTDGKVRRRTSDGTYLRV